MASGLSGGVRAEGVPSAQTLMVAPHKAAVRVAVLMQL